MKKILALIVIVSTGLISKGQDSARIKIDVIIQARDCEILLYISPLSRKYEDLDSVLKVRFRPPAVAPTGTTNVTLNQIELRVLLDVWRFCHNHLIITQGGTTDRIGTVLKNAGQTWLSNKITKDESDRTDAWTDIRKIGREYGKKETQFD